MDVELVNSDTFTKGQRIDEYDFAITNLYGIPNDDVTENIKFYSHYANCPIIAWICQEEDSDDEGEIKQIINNINPKSKIFEVSDNCENEISTIKDAI